MINQTFVMLLLLGILSPVRMDSNRKLGIVEIHKFLVISLFRLSSNMGVHVFVICGNP